MWRNRADQQKIKELEETVRQARDYIQKIQMEGQARQHSIDAWQGGSRFMLSQLEGEWEVPVRWADAPAGVRAVVTLDQIEEPDGAKALTVFSLQSAFADRARLEDLSQSGWAVVRAWPMNVPGGAANLAGSSNDRYVMCALTAMGLWEAGRPSDSPSPSIKRSGSGGLEIRA